MSRARVGLAAFFLAACAASPRTPDHAGRPPADQRAPPSAAAPPTQPSTLPPAAQAADLVFIEDDVPAALAKARAAGKALFVDAWAPWCHTCISMKGYVFRDPSLRPLSERVVFAAIDTDRDVNAAFLERYGVNVWPTFFVIEPASGRVVGHWTGAASVRELREFVQDSLDALDALGRGTLAQNSALARLLDAKAAQADGRHREAADRFAEALAAAPRDWSRKSEALLGQLQALYYSGRHADCVRFGIERIAEVQGAARPADFSGYVLSCAGHVRDAKLVRAARDAAVRRLRHVTEHPSPEMSIDDRADALFQLGEALRASGDKAAARAADEARLALMEQAARDAPSPQVAATYDPGRAHAYYVLGRPEEAVKLLEQRQKELPDSYEPPARLADALVSMGRHREALPAVERALELSYGRRRLRYLALKATIAAALADRALQIATLEQEVAGWKALPPAQARPQSLRDAEQRLAAARKAKP